MDSVLAVSCMSAHSINGYKFLDSLKKGVVHNFFLTSSQNIYIFSDNINKSKLYEVNR